MQFWDVGALSLIMRQNKLAVLCVALVPLAVSVTGAAHAQPGGPATSPPPPPSRPTNPDVPPQSGSGSSQSSGGASVGVQIDVGQVIGSLAKLRREREAQRKEREAAAAAQAQRAAEAAATAARDKAQADISAITKPIDPAAIAVNTKSTEPLPVPVLPKQVRPDVMFTPSMPPKLKLVPKSVATTQSRADSPPTLPTRKLSVAPKLPVAAAPQKALPVVAKVPSIAAQVVKPAVAIAPIVPETVPEAVIAPLEIASPLPLPTPQNAPIDALPTTIQAPILAVPPTQVAVPSPGEKPAPSWPLWAAIGLGILAAWALLGRLLGSKTTQQSTQDESDQPDRTITGRGLIDEEPQPTLTFDDGKGLLPAILTSQGETHSVLVFDTDSAIS